MGARLLAVVAWALFLPSGVRAGEPADTAGPGVTLEQYLEAMAARRLLAEETGSADRLRALVRRAEELYFDQRFDEAALLLFEVAESPRFADFVELDEFRGAELMLASAVHELGALRTAHRYLLRILRRGPADRYFGPAYRRYTDVALESGDLVGAVERVEGLGGGSLPEDARNELQYMMGRTHYDAGNLARAEEHFAAVTRKSRFYANAQYLRGVMDVRRRELGRAEEHFCSIAKTEDQEVYSFYVDERYFRVKDLAWLALGRVAHEGGRADDAFYYYFQVPQDSARVSEALFESAYAMYEGEDHDTAIDLLDQLEARFPSSPYVDEAALLRGYIHLARCEFEAADRLFRQFQARFEPVVAEVDRVLASPARQQRFYRDLLEEARDRGERAARARDGEANLRERSTRETILALLRIDPAFYRLHSDVRTLDAEAARAGRLATDLGALQARLEGTDRPREAAPAGGYATEVEELRDDIDAARAVLGGLTEQLDEMRAARAPAEKLEPLEGHVRTLAGRIDGLEAQLTDRVGAAAAVAEPDLPGDDLAVLLARDRAHAHRLPARVVAVRGKLVRAANAAALRALRDLRSRLAGELRRSRIGRIDAVMGSKRRIEIQIESLAAGRFPAELQDPLHVQGLLRDDEEYWPFEGELWQDEFDETVPLEALD